MVRIAFYMSLLGLSSLTALGADIRWSNSVEYMGKDSKIVFKEDMIIPANTETLTIGTEEDYPNRNGRRSGHLKYEFSKYWCFMIVNPVNQDRVITAGRELVFTGQNTSTRNVVVDEEARERWLRCGNTPGCKKQAEEMTTYVLLDKELGLKPDKDVKSILCGEGYLKVLPLTPSLFTIGQLNSALKHSGAEIILAPLKSDSNQASGDSIYDFESQKIP